MKASMNTPVKIPAPFSIRLQRRPMSSYSSPDGVVNPDLTVKGTSGLRVVDLSVIVSVSYIPLLR